MPRSLYRWKTFWFGLFIVLLLAGGWLRSIHFAEKVTFGDPVRTSFAEVGQSSGMYFVTVSHRPEPAVLTCFEPFIGHSGDSVATWRNPHGSPSYSLAPPIGAEHQATWWTFGIAHWLLILLFLPVWLILLARHRRLIRQLEPILSGTTPAS